jgi:hypothetical protein
MKRSVKQLIRILSVLPLALAACGGGGIEPTSEGAVGPQEIANATEVIKFDPTSIPTSGEAAPGACAASAIAPGTYRCELADGAPSEPCFALGGTQLVCGPDPVAGTVAHLVSPTSALPAVVPTSPDRTVPFFVELADGMTCAVRAAPEPVIIDGVAASYDCNAPYTYLLGEPAAVFNRDAPVWRAGVYLLDPATGQSPSGAIAKDVARVWIP